MASAVTVNQPSHHLVAPGTTLKLDKVARYVTDEGGYKERWVALRDGAKLLGDEPKNVLERFIALSKTPTTGLPILNWSERTFLTVLDPATLDYTKNLLVPAGWWSKVEHAEMKWNVYRVELVPYIQTDPLDGFPLGTIYPVEQWPDGVMPSIDFAAEPQPRHFLLQVGYQLDGNPTPYASYGKPPLYAPATCPECQEAKGVCSGHHGCRAPHTLRDLERQMAMVRNGTAKLGLSPTKGCVIYWTRPE